MYQIPQPGKTYCGEIVSIDYERGVAIQSVETNPHAKYVFERFQQFEHNLSNLSDPGSLVEGQNIEIVYNQAGQGIISDEMERANDMAREALTRGERLLTQETHCASGPELPISHHKE